MMLSVSFRLNLLILVVGIFPALASAETPSTRPGKGLTFIPGDFAEYSNTEFSGDKKTVLASTIMIAVGKVGQLEGVQVLSVRDRKLISKAFLHFDLTKAKVEQGEKLETGKEVLTIQGKKFECTWEKRRNNDVVGTFWRCSDLPFEKYAKVEMLSEDGRKMVTELIIHGPDIKNNEQSRQFLKRLEELKTQIPAVE